MCGLKCSRDNLRLILLIVNFGDLVLLYFSCGLLLACGLQRGSSCLKKPVRDTQAFLSVLALRIDKLLSHGLAF
jgi:hypothetical protein